MNQDFSEHFSTPGMKAYMWGDDPFVVTAFCVQAEDGYLVDWWVSGRTRKLELPSLLIRMKSGIDAEPNELEHSLSRIWETSLRDIAFGSAIFGGVLGSSQELAEMPEELRQRLFDFHLQGHSRFGNFNKEGNSKIERTANMYKLLKTFGSTQPQKAIAAFESLSLVDEVKPAIVNQRLALAKKAGLLTANSQSEVFRKFLTQANVNFSQGKEQ